MGGGCERMDRLRRWGVLLVIEGFIGITSSLLLYDAEVHVSYLSCSCSK